MRAILLVALVCALLASASAKAPNPPPPFFVKARAAVAELLRDPRAAQFRGLYQKDDAGLRIVFGEVNGKNAYGGYVGFRRFIYFLGTSDAAIAPDEDALIAPDEDAFRDMSIEERAASNALIVRCLQARQDCPKSARRSA